MDESIFLDNSLLKFIKIKNLDVNKLSKENKEFLREIGLPYINTKYFKFFPFENLEKRVFQDKLFYVLGSPISSYQKRNNDNLIGLSINDQHIYFVSFKFYEIDFMSKPITIVNSSLLSFVYFNILFMNITELILEKENSFSMKEIKDKFIDFIKKLKYHDKLALGKQSDHSFFWRKNIYTLIQNIEEKYDRPLNLDIDKII